jgi:DNA replication protein DnaC
MKVTPPTLREILDSYNHIELTDDEMLEGMIWAKRKKEETIRLQKLKDFEEQNRKIKAMRFNYDVCRTWMMNRAKQIFNKDFELDTYNEKIFNIMCYYFIDDEESFTSICKDIGVKNPSLKKGFLIPGNFGVGKTWLMLLFSRQPKQCFDLVRAKDIAEEFLKSKDKQIPAIYLKPIDVRGDETGKPIDRTYPSEEVFNQRFLGLCIDDLGSESVQNNFGTKMNVIGDLIESRYHNGYTGVFLHGTTNMNAAQLEAFYGKRVISRMREIFNFIELPGDDRRK